ncbi:MAG: hypothetical protein PV344_04945, partial [Anaplasma sp.]|nr:hypothetical protein [Anaplasma sp.]
SSIFLFGALGFFVGFSCLISGLLDCERFNVEYCKRLNFCMDLIFANFANRLRFAKKLVRRTIRAICQHYGRYIRFAKIRTRE